MNSYVFVENHPLFLKSSSLVSCSFFCGLKDGAIIAKVPLFLNVSYCIFEDLVKEGCGACIESESPNYLKVEKCSAKSCGVFSNDETIANSHVIYVNSLSQKETFMVNGISISLCSSSVLSDQRSIIRSSQTDSVLCDVNITDSCSNYHAILTRQFKETKLKRIFLNRVKVNGHFLNFEYMSTFIDKMAIRNATFSNDIFIYQSQNRLTITDSEFNIELVKLVLVDSLILFNKCHFLIKAPASSNGVTVSNSVTSIEFGENIINAREILRSILSNVNNQIKKSNRFAKPLLVVIFLISKFFS